MEFDDTELNKRNKVHIRIQQRNGRKSITTIQGLASDLDLYKILQSLKKNFKCNGSVSRHKQYGDIIQLQGDQRESCKNFLVDHEIVQAADVEIHGF